MNDVIAVVPRVAALFGAGGMALLAARRRPDISVLTARLRTWVIIALVWFGALALGRGGVVALASGCGIAAAFEFGRLTVARRAPRGLLLVAGGLLPVASLLGGSIWLVSLAAMLLAITVPPLLRQDVEHGFAELAASCLGVLWIGAACSALAVLPVPLLALVGVATATADIGGFVGGAMFGRHHLAPLLSPNKTWEGVAGSAVLATLGAVLTVDVVGLALWSAPVIGIAVALAATWGDLLESLVKRCANRKDAGNWLPGFGGLLDRIDSLLVTAPIAWIAMMLLGGMA